MRTYQKTPFELKKEAQLRALMKPTSRRALILVPLLLVCLLGLKSLALNYEWVRWMNLGVLAFGSWFAWKNFGLKGHFCRLSVVFMVFGIFIQTMRPGIDLIRFNPGEPVDLAQAVRENKKYIIVRDVIPDLGRKKTVRVESKTRQNREPMNPFSLEQPYRSSTSGQWALFPLVNSSLYSPVSTRPIEGWLVCEELSSSTQECMEGVLNFRGGLIRVSKPEATRALREMSEPLDTQAENLWEPSLSLGDEVRKMAKESSFVLGMCILFWLVVWIRLALFYQP